jgi:hypothetical protein
MDFSQLTKRKYYGIMVYITIKMYRDGYEQKIKKYPKKDMSFSFDALCLLSGFG